MGSWSGVHLMMVGIPRMVLTSSLLITRDWRREVSVVYRVINSTHVLAPIGE